MVSASVYTEKVSGYIFDIKKFAVHDGPGIRTTVFLKGCPAQCWWCHNPESQEMKPQDFTRTHNLDGFVFKDKEQAGRWITVDDVMIEILKERLFMDQSAGGITFSGGEPFLQPDFLAALIRRSKQENIHVAVDTTGYVHSAVMKKLMGDIDLFLYDLKIMDSKIHTRYTGVPNELILKNLKYLISQKKRIRIRFPVIPGITDESKNIDQIHSYLATIAPHIERLDLLAFHKIALEKYHRFGLEFKMAQTKEPSEEYMVDIQRRFQSLDIPMSIGG